MNFKKNKMLWLTTTLTLLSLNACSSHNDIVSISEAHYFDQNFGVTQNSRADAIIQQELYAMNEPTQIEVPTITDPSITTELIREKGTFLEDEYVQPPEIITYKYKFDPKFYSNAEWRKMP